MCVDFIYENWHVFDLKTYIYADGYEHCAGYHDNDGERHGSFHSQLQHESKMVTRISDIDRSTILLYVHICVYNLSIQESYTASQ